MWPLKASAKLATLSLCVGAEFVGIAAATQRSSVVMHSAGGQRKRAVVIGGSIGGLFAGLFLRKVGWEVSIHERAGEDVENIGAARRFGKQVADPLRRNWSTKRLRSRPESGEAIALTRGEFRLLRLFVSRPAASCWRHLEAVETGRSNCSTARRRAGACVVGSNLTQGACASRHRPGEGYRRRQRAGVAVAPDNSVAESIARFAEPPPRRRRRGLPTSQPTASVPPSAATPHAPVRLRRLLPAVGLVAGCSPPARAGDGHRATCLGRRAMTSLRNAPVSPSSFCLSRTGAPTRRRTIRRR